MLGAILQHPPQIVLEVEGVRQRAAVLNEVLRAEAGGTDEGELHGEVASTNADFKKVYESLPAFSNNGYQWFQVAEVGYDNFMARHSQG